MRLTSIEFSFDSCNIYRDGPRGVGYPSDARSVGDSHPIVNNNNNNDDDDDDNNNNNINNNNNNKLYGRRVRPIRYSPARV